MGNQTLTLTRLRMLQHERFLLQEKLEELNREIENTEKQLGNVLSDKNSVRPL